MFLISNDNSACCTQTFVIYQQVVYDNKNCFSLILINSVYIKLCLKWQGRTLIIILRVWGSTFFYKHICNYFLQQYLFFWKFNKLNNLRISMPPPHPPPYPTPGGCRPGWYIVATAGRTVQVSSLVTGSNPYNKADSYINCNEFVFLYSLKDVIS